MTYPYTPGWRASSIGDTARNAAKSMEPKAPNLRNRVLDLIERQPSIPETIFAALKRDGVSTVLTSVRPRCSELARMGLICDSGRREPAEGGCMAVVWRATTEIERAAFNARKAGGAD